MGVKVSASNITGLTVAAAAPGATTGSAPTADEMIRQVRASLQKRVQQQVDNMKQAQSLFGSSAPFDSLHIAAEADLRNFEEIVNHVPKGFALAPVFYTRIDDRQKTAAYAEYTNTVRAAFMTFLAKTCAHELRALGICEAGISRMKQGGSPVDEKGRIYRIDVDHIIERGGAGALIDECARAVDPLRPGGNAKLPVNHFRNLILLPEQVHAAKNTLNGVQNYRGLRPGEGRWVLMLVPADIPGHSGFVAMPQDKGHHLHGLATRDEAPMRPRGRVSAAADEIYTILTDILSDPAVSALVIGTMRRARGEQRSVSDIVLQEKTRPAHNFRPTLSQAFNKAAPKAAGLNSLLGALEDALSKALTGAVRAEDGDDRRYAAFIKMFRHPAMRGLHAALRTLPHEDAAFLTAKLDKLNRFLDRHPQKPSSPEAAEVWANPLSGGGKRGPKNDSKKGGFRKGGRGHQNPPRR